MPVIKSAKKKLRQDKIRTARRAGVEEFMKKLLKKARKSPTAENVRLAVKATDKAAKIHIIHKNKAAHVKSSLAKLTGDTSSAPKVAAKKTATKKTTKTAKK